MKALAPIILLMLSLVVLPLYYAVKKWLMREIFIKNTLSWISADHANKSWAEILDNLNDSMRAAIGGGMAHAAKQKSSHAKSAEQMYNIAKSVVTDDIAERIFDRCFSVADAKVGSILNQELHGGGIQGRLWHTVFCREAFKAGEHLANLASSPAAQFEETGE